METFKEAFYAKYPENHKIIEYFEEANGCEFIWENITKVRLQKYVRFLEDRLAPYSVATYCSRIKSILNFYSDEIELPKGFEKALQSKKGACQHVYLNDEEIKPIIQYNPQTRAEKIIKNWFLIGCFTGARHSDYITFTSKNLRDGMLHYVSIKTHTKTSIPLSSILEKLIKEKEEERYCDIQFTDVYFNKLIKRICRNAGIVDEVSVYMRGKFQTGEKWVFVASHTARRSFATNLFKRGVDILTISKLCGHSSVEMTKQYICCGPIISDAVMEYFNTFDSTK